MLTADDRAKYAYELANGFNLSACDSETWGNACNRVLYIARDDFEAGRHEDCRTGADLIKLVATSNYRIGHKAIFKNLHKATIWTLRLAKEERELLEKTKNALP